MRQHRHCVRMLHAAVDTSLLHLVPSLSERAPTSRIRVRTLAVHGTLCHAAAHDVRTVCDGQALRGELADVHPLTTTMELETMAEQDIRIAAVLAAYNRRQLTLECLGALEAQQPAGVDLHVYVLDDASTDGTAAAIHEQFPRVTVLHGDGRQYWNGGMRRAFGAAIAHGYDCYLWMNDDTTLDDGALTRLLEVDAHLRARGERAAIVVGTTRDPDSGEPTYGGRVRPSRWTRPLYWELVKPSDEPQQCETMNGNVVLLPHAVVERVGNIDPRYVQQMGDHDYGLRARAAGCTVWVAPGTIGTCAQHPPRRTDQQPFMQEWSRSWSVKQQPFRPWAVFSRRWAGPLWPIFWASPYLRRGVRLAEQRIAQRLQRVVD